MLWGDRIIRHDLRVCDNTSVAILDKDKVYLTLGAPTMDTLTIGFTRPVTETTMTAVPVFHGTYVPSKVTSNYDGIFRRYFCCLLIKQTLKPIVGLIEAASLRSIRKEEVIESLLSGDNDLHQSIVKAFDTSNRVTKSLGDDYSDTTAGPELPHRTVLKPHPMSLDLRQDHLVSCTSSSLQCFNQLARAARQRTHIQHCHSGPAYVTGLSD
ncbi:unnamed protein product [Heligmosomoides polygyrus]|uniref:Uncharacterized protein n=1 Tax=Heligmosomoides polygyrus TaxID=6339 RepID=A0A183G4B5_HELPZ|nr:unnamed protein product [Heligmosomoides polygyrus]